MKYSTEGNSLFCSDNFDGLRANGLAFSCRERAGLAFKKRTISREAVGCNAGLGDDRVEKARVSRICLKQHAVWHALGVWLALEVERKANTGFDQRQCPCADVANRVIQGLLVQGHDL